MFCSIQISPKIFPILRTIQLDIVINIKMSSCKAPAILVGFYWNLNFLDMFSKKDPILRKSFQWYLNCSMRKEGRTDKKKVIVAFSNLANAFKNRARNFRTNFPTTSGNAFTSLSINMRTQACDFTSMRQTGRCTAWLDKERGLTAKVSVSAGIPLLLHSWCEQNAVAYTFSS